MSSGREGISEVHTKQFDFINLVDARQSSSYFICQKRRRATRKAEDHHTLVAHNGAAVRKCLLFGLRNIISTILSLLIVSLLRLDQSSRWPNSVATSADDFSATSKVVSSAYLIIRATGQFVAGFDNSRLCRQCVLCTGI